MFLSGAAPAIAGEVFATGLTVLPGTAEMLAWDPTGLFALPVKPSLHLFMAAGL